jgi:predicted regulator of amino acid metabolism with ACT domain
MIGKVGTAFGEADINISFMGLGRDAEGELALMALAADEPVPPELVRRLETTDGIQRVHVVDLA